MYKKICIKRIYISLITVNEINGKGNLLPVNDISVACDKTLKSHLVVILRKQILTDVDIRYIWAINTSQ